MAEGVKLDKKSGRQPGPQYLSITTLILGFGEGMEALSATGIITGYRFINCPEEE